jgi:hypothetical protein
MGLAGGPASPSGTGVFAAGAARRGDVRPWHAGAELRRDAGDPGVRHDRAGVRRRQLHAVRGGGLPHVRGRGRRRHLGTNTAYERPDGGVDIHVDVNHDGKVDFIGRDYNRDGLVDDADFDTELDGAMDTRMYDDNGDGWMDRSGPCRGRTPTSRTFGQAPAEQAFGQAPPSRLSGRPPPVADRYAVV